MIKVLICDDHKIFLNGLKSGIQSLQDIKVVGEACNGKETLLFLLKAKNVDVVLLDIEMPEMNGIDITHKIKAKHPHTEVIALTMYDNARMINEMIKAGAKGYLTKNTSIKEIGEAIKSVHRGEAFFKGGVLNKIIEFSSESSKATRYDLLTAREKEVLKLIASGKPNNEIAQELFISVHTVNSHRKNILKKLDAKNTVGLIYFASKNGLI
jgi:DNA-binding NarL/FixJ family response regulator